MNIEELGDLIHKKNIPSNLYNLDGIGRKDERFCIELNGYEWAVYFTERGIRTTEVKFSYEDEACNYLLKQLVDI